MALMTDLLKRKIRGKFEKKEESADKEAAEIVELAEKIKGEVGKMEQTVAAFLDFARAPRLQPSGVDLAALARELGGYLRNTPAVSGEATAWADEKAARVALGNLMANADQAAAGLSPAVAVALSRDGGRVRISVWDSGEPVPGEQRAMLFTPFFTTKDKGLGLGLATAASLAQAMEGRVYLEKDGKTFVMILPSKDRG
jgi:signal transduction histidine kinase